MQIALDEQVLILLQGVCVQGELIEDYHANTAGNQPLEEHAHIVTSHTSARNDLVKIN